MSDGAALPAKDLAPAQSPPTQGAAATEGYFETVARAATQARRKLDGTLLPEPPDGADEVEAALAKLPRLALTGGAGPAELAIGQTLGQGGMGVVRGATQLSIGRTVAVKAVRPEHTSPAATLELLREAWVTGLLEHPNIVPVYALGRADDGTPMFVMKRIEGTSWRELLAARPAAALTDEAELDRHLEILFGVMNAVAFAHSRGVVHRDLKPDNVMVGSFGEVYVLDWGLAVGLRADPRVPRAVDVRGVAGTPAYMAPEMARSDAQALSERTDVYLLGAILHELLTGAPPHAAPTVVDSLASAWNADAPTFDVAVPAELAAVARRALAAEPRERFRSVEEMRRALQTYRMRRSSRQLTQEATARLDAFAARVDGAPSPDEVVHVYNLFGECRFGFRQALRTWEGNDDARDGLSDALGLMLDFELRQGALPAARVLLEELEALRGPRPELARHLSDLEAERAERQAELVRLERFSRENDLSFAARRRSVLVYVQAAFWGVVNLAAAAVEHFGRYQITAVDMLVATLLASLGLAGAVLRLRGELLGNSVNRRLMLALMATTAATPALWALAALTGRPVPVVLSEGLIIFSVASGIAAIGIDRRLTATSLTFTAACIVAYLVPALGFVAMAVGTAVGLTAIGRAWTRIHDPDADEPRYSDA